MFSMLSLRCAGVSVTADGSTKTFEYSRSYRLGLLVLSPRVMRELPIASIARVAGISTAVDALGPRDGNCRYSQMYPCGMVTEGGGEEKSSYKPHQWYCSKGCEEDWLESRKCS